MGYIYIAKLYLMPKTYITKIGATSNPSNRMCNLGKNLKICCISKPHYNYFENEKILHDYYETYRVPNSPNARSKDIRPELFMISLVDIFKTIPSLNFETNLEDCVSNTYANGKAVYYTSKKRVIVQPTKATRLL